MIRPSFAVVLFGVSLSAHATDLPQRNALKIFDPPPPPAFSWSGAYIGVNLGAAVAGDFKVRTVDPMPRADFRTSLGGYAVGGTLGFNHQFTPGRGLVVGLELDGAYADLHAKASVEAPASGVSTRGELATDSYFASLRGRVGYAFGPVLAYVTGGWAATEMGVNARATVPAFSLAALGTFKGFSGSIAKSMPIDGYIVGAGIEYAVTPGVSLKAEYLYANLDRTISRRFEGLQLHLNGGLDVHQFKVGANYRFGALSDALGLFGH